MRRWVSVAALFGAGCSSSTQDIPTLVVEQSLFEVQIRAQGELKAATSTPVKVPGELWGRQTLGWLVEDGAVVKAGDVVARLDDTEIAIQETDSAREVRKADLQIEGQGSTHRHEKQELANAIHINNVELNVAGKFAQHDKLIFSRNQVIDAEINLEFLQAKGGLLDSKQARLSKKHATDRQLLSLQRQTHSLKMLQVQEQRGRMALIAPHDGLFVAGRNWDGEKFKVGSQLWRGQEIGSLPDVSKMEALVRVLESEMSGVTVGVPASLVLDAYPQRIFHGKVKLLAAVANPIERDSPVKYFDVTIEIDETDPAVLKPGLRVNSTLAAKRQEGVIAIPNQAIFRKGEEVWVLVKNGSGFDKRNVTLGERSPTRTVVASGLEPGDAIALGNAEAS